MLKIQKHCLLLLILATIFSISCSSKDPEQKDPPTEATPTEKEPPKKDPPKKDPPKKDPPKKDPPKEDPNQVYCDSLNLHRTKFQPVDAPGRWNGPVADFTLSTGDGEWKFSEKWSGCDNLIFFNYDLRDQSGQDFWGSVRDMSKMFANSPKNVHYFFGPNSNKEASSFDKIKKIVFNSIKGLSPEESNYWSYRIHFLSEPYSSSTGSLKEVFSSTKGFTPGVAVTRLQTFDYLGSLTSIGRGGFYLDINPASYNPHYYNYMYDLEHALKNEGDVTEVVLLDKELRQGTPEKGDPDNNYIFTAQLPPKEEMLTFNEMEIEVTATCGPAFSDCGEWDYESFLLHCRDKADATCAENDEILYWITPYSRPGTRKWVAKATSFLPLIQDGGEQAFKFVMRWYMNHNHYTFKLRLKKKDEAPRPTNTTPLYTGGDFGADYNDKYMPHKFTPPADVKKVEIAGFITGHGHAQPYNCSEWCEHEHTFTVNGTDNFQQTFEDQVGEEKCADKVSQGVVPNQGGNWVPGRAAWCPGLVVQPFSFDITDKITLGAENTITYKGSFNGKTPPGGDGNRIHMSSYLVYYK